MELSSAKNVGILVKLTQITTQNIPISKNPSRIKLELWALRFYTPRIHFPVNDPFSRLWLDPFSPSSALTVWLDTRQKEATIIKRALWFHHWPHTNITPHTATLDKQTISPSPVQSSNQATPQQQWRLRLSFLLSSSSSSLCSVSYHSLSPNRTKPAQRNKPCYKSRMTGATQLHWPPGATPPPVATATGQVSHARPMVSSHSSCCPEKTSLEVSLPPSANSRAYPISISLTTTYLAPSLHSSPIALTSNTSIFLIICLSVKYHLMSIWCFLTLPISVCQTIISLVKFRRVSVKWLNWNLSV